MNGDFDEIATWRRSLDRSTLHWIQQGLAFLARHWLFLLNLINFSIVGVAILDPILMRAGLLGIGSSIFTGYHALCHQLPFRSDLLFGYQIAMCQRDVAIYSSMALAGAAFGLARERWRPLSWRLYLLLIFPMALDGFTQLFGWRESNWTLRTVTGALFGISSVWLTYPRIQEAVKLHKPL
ncbi:MAG: DUF2085 domain-containing protein [Chloroflexi bacterium]|nr:DUF2085 domain-containing protein [Chloroflexota bacterium]